MRVSVVSATRAVPESASHRENGCEMGSVASRTFCLLVACLLSSPEVSGNAHSHSVTVSR